jgi:tetratricopeptide (TPR) repeat protein
MIRDFSKGQAPIAFCLMLLLGCSQSNSTNEDSLADSNAGQSPFDQLYQLAGQKNQQCIVLCDSLISATSDQNTRAEAYFIKGLYYANTQDLKKASQYFDSTIQENYTYYDAYIEKGILLHQQDAFQEALETLQIALNLTKNNPDLYYWIGKSYEGLKKNKEAIRFYEWTLQSDPNYEAAEEALKRIKQ